ncbi:MAG: DNA alkylation repair protein [Candidatus Absconditabacteria bacterium]
MNLEKYFKNVIKFIGVKGPGIKSIFKDYKKLIFSLENNEQDALGFMFLKSKHFEMKQIGICIFESKHKKLDKIFLNEIKLIIDLHIYNWGNCDTLSSRVMGNMIRNNSEYANTISD